MYPIKQFGLPRSGTNIVKALLELNFKDTFVLSNYLGNKHDPTSWESIDSFLAKQEASEFGLNPQQAGAVYKLVDSRNLPVVINVKDLVSWVASYYRYQRKKMLFKNPEAIFEFDKSFCRKSIPQWESNMKSWMQFVAENRGNCIVASHHDLLLNARDVLLDAESRFNLSRKSESLVYKLDQYAKRGTDHDHGADLLHINKKIDVDYHLKNRWIDEVPKETLSFLIEEANRVRSKSPNLARFVNVDF